MTLEESHYFVTIMSSCNLILQSCDNRSTSDQNPFNNRLTIVQQQFNNRSKIV